MDFERTRSCAPREASQHSEAHCPGAAPPTVSLRFSGRKPAALRPCRYSTGGRGNCPHADSESAGRREIDVGATRAVENCGRGLGGRTSAGNQTCTRQWLSYREPSLEGTRKARHIRAGCYRNCPTREMVLPLQCSAWIDAKLSYTGAPCIGYPSESYRRRSEGNCKARASVAASEEIHPA